MSNILHSQLKDEMQITLLVLVLDILTIKELRVKGIRIVRNSFYVRKVYNILLEL